MYRNVKRNLCDFKNKDERVFEYVQYMTMRTGQMFKYKNLPDTMPAEFIEYFIQTGGHAVVCEVDGKLYAMQGGWGGAPDAYYRPKTYTVANPGLNFSKTLELGKDAVLIYNDSRYMGLLPMFKRYSTLLVENDLTISIAEKLSRCEALLAAGTTKAANTAKQFIESIDRGELGIIADNAMLESIKTMPYASGASNTITNLIELEQYIKASWFNELGLSANYNMKREAINSSEAQLGQDALLPLIDDMLHCRQKFVAEINALFGTDITVSFHSAWDREKEAIDYDEVAEDTTCAETEDGSAEIAEDSDRIEENENNEEEHSIEVEENDENDEIVEEVERNDDRAVENQEVIEVPVSDAELDEALEEGGEKDD